MTFDDLDALEAMPVPATKAELLKRMPPARAALETVLSPLADAEMVTPGFEGWSVKDHLAHIAAWQRIVIAFVRDRSDHLVVGMEREAYAKASVQQKNDHLHARMRDLPLADVMAEFRNAYADIVRLIESISDTALAAPARPENTTSRSLLEGITPDTYQHDLEHRRFILEVLGKRG